ncbi:hypothetical protein BDR05DRAFT_949541 [Suillus weaverae]|nr:hypothetical protein BDR05DRAFT_949541 [Suillus weaverae]
MHEWEDTDEPIYKLPDDLTAITELPIWNGKDCTTIVDKSGVHSLLIRFCQCPNSCTPDKQLFKAGMFLASFTRPKTAFTFPVLDGFLLDNLECGTSALNYYNKLRQMTSSIFPHLVPPGVNAPGPAEWDGDGPSWLYTRSLVMDGNFKAEHLHPTHPEDEVWLTDGGCACARHSCFVPHSMVDFQKGKRQMNMDYALCHALGHNTDGIKQAFTFYNINCQYNKHFRCRVKESLYLSIPSKMEIVPGIGLWHVHGHQD